MSTTNHDLSRMNRSSRNTKNRTVRFTVISLAVVLVTALLAALVYGGVLYNKANIAIGKIAGAEGVSDGGDAAAGSAGNRDAFRPMTFLLMGVDNREGNASMNTDVIMLVALNPKTQSATIVSLPRDLQLKPQGLLSRKANYYYPHYYIDDEETAIAKTKKLFSEGFHIPIDYTAVIDFQGFRDVVDELGGLRLEVDMDMRYVDNEDGTDINLRKGLQTLNGKEALDFVRYRKSNRGTAESSDSARNMRQQMVISKLLDKMTSLGGIAKWGGILDIAGRSVQTDIPEAEIRAWIKSFRTLKPDTTEFIHIDGEWLSPYIVPKEDDLIHALSALRERLGREPLSEREARQAAAFVQVLGGGSERDQPVNDGNAGKAGGSTGSGRATPPVKKSPRPQQSPSATPRPAKTTPAASASPGVTGRPAETAPTGSEPAATPKPSASATPHSTPVPSATPAATPAPTQQPQPSATSAAGVTSQP